MIFGVLSSFMLRDILRVRVVSRMSGGISKGERHIAYREFNEIGGPSWDIEILMGVASSFEGCQMKN